MFGKLGFLSIFFIIGLAIYVLAADPVLKTINPKTPGLSQKIPSTKAKLPAAATKLCPDPAANRLDFNMLKHNNLVGVVEISGVAKNLGGPYETKANQQQLMLYEGSRMVASTVFGNLAPGQEVIVKYNREWRKSDEFPPTYKLIISYDPDILIDSNPQNDDCNNNNNTKSRSGVEINGLF